MVECDKGAAWPGGSEPAKRLRTAGRVGVVSLSQAYGTAWWAAREHVRLFGRDSARVREVR